jgi:raffinose/stachyose/melibiose transport system substrate-binding protein
MHTFRTVKRGPVLALLLLILSASVAACGTGATTGSNSAGVNTAGRIKLTYWFWGASPQEQQIMQKVLVDGFDSSQSKYSLSVTYNNNVDTNIQVALAADGGPDIVYGSGPSFVTEYAPSGKIANMNKYSQEYGWKTRLNPAMYESGTLNGNLYALPTSFDTDGVFYNKAVLKKYGWPVPTTASQLMSEMNQAKKHGLYAGVSGNKGWRPDNFDVANVFLTAEAGPQAVYKALTGSLPWTAAPLVKAVQTSGQWFNAGYFAGSQYFDLNYDDAADLLAQGKAAFWISPTLSFQFLSAYFNNQNGNLSNLGFEPFPTLTSGLPSPLYTLESPSSLSINPYSHHQAGAAEVINYMMSEKFLTEMLQDGWPGYWAVPLANISAQPSQFQGLSKLYLQAIDDLLTAVKAGHMGYSLSTFYPPAVENAFLNIDEVWTHKESAQTFLASVEKAQKAAQAAHLVSPIPKPYGIGQ